jgi:gas vesicle protein
MKNTMTVLVGLLAGLTAGAILGVLLAPAKGSETRRKIMEKGEEYADGLKSKFGELVDEVIEKGDSFRQEAENQVGKAKEKFEGVKKDASNATM